MEEKKRVMKTVDDSRTGAGASDHAPASECRRTSVRRNADAVGG